MMTRSMSAVESPNYSKRESVPAISSAFDFRQLKPSSGNTGNEFLGLCLPVDLTALFQVSETVSSAKYQAIFRPISQDN